MCSIDQFIERYIEVSMNATVLSKSITESYVSYNNGSTAGKIKLINKLKEMEGVSKNKTHFIGLRLKSVQTVVQQVVEQVKPTINVDIDYKMRKLDLMEKMAKEKAINDERLAKELIKQQLEVKSKIAAEKIRIAEEKLKVESETKIKVTEMNIKKDMEIIHLELQDKEKPREWRGNENNKNRLLTSSVRYNRYIDPCVYGTPSQQYITVDSLKENLQFRTFIATREVKSATVADLIKSNADFIETIEVKEDDNLKHISAIKTEKVSNIINNIVENFNEKNKIKYVMQPLDDKLTTFKKNIFKGNKNNLQTTFEEQITQGEQSIKKSTKDKVTLAESSAICDLTKKDGKFHVNCFCCDLAIPLLNAVCQKGHNMPKSKGGSNHDDNIELICANCNMKMGETQTIYEYLSTLYEVKLKETNPEDDK